MNTDTVIKYAYAYYVFTKLHWTPLSPTRSLFVTYNATNSDLFYVCRNITTL